MPVDLAALLLLACVKCTFLCTQGSRVRPASGIPCALLSIEGHEMMLHPGMWCCGNADVWPLGSLTVESDTVGRDAEPTHGAFPTPRLARKADRMGWQERAQPPRGPGSGRANETLAFRINFGAKVAPLGGVRAPHDPYLYDFHCHLHGAGRGIAGAGPLFSRRDQRP